MADSRYLACKVMVQGAAGFELPTAGAMMNSSKSAIHPPFPTTEMPEDEESLNPKLDAIDGINEAKYFVELIWMAAASLDDEECAAIQIVADLAKVKLQSAVQALAVTGN